jgi:hypothetical protein
MAIVTITKAMLERACAAYANATGCYIEQMGMKAALEAALVRSQNREPGNMRFAFDGDMNRMCTCGHRLGVHGPGGIECLAGTNVWDDPNPRGVECECTKFKQSRRKAS